MKFKVGQVWADGYGYHETIVSVDNTIHSGHPVRTNVGSYNTEGHAHGRRPLKANLTTLISEPEETTDIPQTDTNEVQTYHMTKEEYMEHLDETFASIKTLVSGKIDDYTGDSGVFENYNSSTKAGIDPVVGVILRMSDKMQRLYSFSKSGTLVNESAEDAFKDMIGYSLSCLGMMKGKK